MRYTFGAYELQRVSEVGFEEFVNLVKGRSLVRLGDFGSGHVELGLSGQVILRIIVRDDNEIEVNCSSTRNPNEPVSLAVPLGDMPEAFSAWELDRKLRGLRTAYAIFYCLEANRESELAEYLAAHPSGDLERALVPTSDALEIESLSYGSLIATIRTRSRQAFNAIKAVGTVVFPRTRDAFLKKLEASADLAASQAEREAVAAERERFELQRQRLDYLMQLADRFGEGETKEILSERLRTAMYELGTGDTDEAEIRRNARALLPKPSERK